MSELPKPSIHLQPLVFAWLVLVTLTLISLELGGRFHGSQWLQVVVAVIVWLKGWLVSRHFIEVHLATRFIRHLLQGFIAVAPLALVLTAFFWDVFARWATL